MARNHLLPRMRLAGFHTVEGFSECHLAQNVKRQHLKPYRHIQSRRLGCGCPRRLQLRDESVDAALYDILLFRERLPGGGRRKKALHLRVSDRIALAPDAAALESCAEDVVEITLGKTSLVRPRSVYIFPGSDRGKGELIRGDAEDDACGYQWSTSATVERAVIILEYHIFDAHSRLRDGNGRPWSV